MAVSTIPKPVARGTKTGIIEHKSILWDTSFSVTTKDGTRGLLLLGAGNLFGVWANNTGVSVSPLVSTGAYNITTNGYTFTVSLGGTPFAATFFYTDI